MPIVWNLFFFFFSAYSVNCYFILFSFILLMATAFLSIAGKDSLNVFSQKSYVREAIRWLRPITENWRYSWKFDRKANITESNSHCFFKYFNCNQFQAIWAGRGRGCFWGRLGGTRRRVGDRDMGGGEGASVRFGGWPRSICMQPNLHKMRLLIHICFLSDLVESCLLTFAFALSMDQLTYKQKSDINSKVWVYFVNDATPTSYWWRPPF